ncbi:MAG TPA: serine/threonine-protein kinase [Trichocoleus sp.]
MTTLCLNPACSQPENADEQAVCQSCGQLLHLARRYRPIRLIGQGGFGRTFLAADESAQLPALCVIKQSWGRSGNAADLSRRFWQEAERLKELGHHPQIPQLLDTFELENGQFLVQEYIPGPNLDQRLADQGPFGDDDIRRLLAEILPLLQLVHSRQIIHRDVKPANLIAPSQSAALVLVDFGAAKSLQADLSLRTGTVIGSAGYAAPEQILGQATFASDLYSLGATCIHLLTGQHPFDLYSVSEDRWVWRTYLHESVSPKLARILDQMLSRGLRERYSSAEAVLADLNWASPLNKPAETSRFKLPFSRLRTQRPAPVLPLEASTQWREVRRIQLPSGVANGLAVSPNGRAIASAASDQTVRLWDMADGSLIHTFARRLGFWGAGHQDAVTAVAFSPDGYLLYSASQDGALKAWDLATYQLQWYLRSSGWGISALALTADGQTLITAGGAGKIHLWDASSGELRLTLAHHQEWVSSLALSSDGQQLVSSSWDKTLRLWHLPTGRLLQTLAAPAVRITAVVWDQDKKLIYSGDSQGNVQRWQLQPPQSTHLVGQHSDGVTVVVTSADGQWLASGSEDGTLQVWNLTTKARAAVLKHGWGVRAATFTPDSQSLVSSSADETIRIWQPVL